MIVLSPKNNAMMKEGDDEMKIFSDMIAFLGQLQKLGYKKVWINTKSPHSTILVGTGHVIASPAQKMDGWPALWRCKKIEALGFESSCGNGLGKADQRQFSKINHLPPGEYDLTKPIHTLVTRLK